MNVSRQCFKIIILVACIALGFIIFSASKNKLMKSGLTTNQNPISSSVFSAIGSSAVENDTITCIKECPASMLYRTLCPCLNKKLNRLMKTLGSIQYDVAADRRSLREYIDHSLLLEEEALTAENTADIEHASLFAEKLKLQQFNVETLLTIHRIALAQDNKIAGKIRSHPMFVPKGPGDIFLRMPEPQELDILLENYFTWFHSELEQKSTHPIVFAAMAKLLFIRIHPFSDGNGRVSRILLNVILRKTLLPFWTFIPSNEITKYYNVIGDVEEGLNLVPYLSYVITCIERSLKMYLEDQKNQRIDLRITAGNFCVNFFHVFLTICIVCKLNFLIISAGVIFIFVWFF